MLLVVVDGRQPGYSRGMTLRELAELLQRLGATQAMNLDGGGSSEMVVNGLTASRPSDGQGRGIANALVVCPAPTTGSRPPPSTCRRSGAACAGRPAPDGGSTGGLADALLRDGVPCPPSCAARPSTSGPPGLRTGWRALREGCPKLVAWTCSSSPPTRRARRRSSAPARPG
jgi:hypothetical protein